MVDRADLAALPTEQLISRVRALLPAVTSHFNRQAVIFDQFATRHPLAAGLVGARRSRDAASRAVAANVRSTYLALELVEAYRDGRVAEEQVRMTLIPLLEALYGQIG